MHTANVDRLLYHAQLYLDSIRHEIGTLVYLESFDTLAHCRYLAEMDTSTWSFADFRNSRKRGAR